MVDQAYVDGALLDGDNGTFEVLNPARGDVIANIADMSRAQVAKSISAAEAAQKDWAAWTGKERATVLRKWYELMLENADDLATILTAEQGKPLAEAKAEIVYGASFIEFFAEEAKRIYGETIPGHQRDKRITVIKQPIGVAASITPRNFPHAMITRKAGPALGHGPGCAGGTCGHSEGRFEHRDIFFGRRSGQGVLRKPGCAQNHHHRLDGGGADPLAASGRSSAQMLHGTGRECALYRV